MAINEANSTSAAQNKKVVSIAPGKKNLGVTTYAPITYSPANVPQNADRAERYNEISGTAEAGLAPTWIGGMTPQERAAYMYTARGTSPTGSGVGTTPVSNIETDPYAGNGFGGGGSGALSASDSLALKKWKQEQAIRQNSISQYQDMLNSGSYRGNQDAMLKILQDMQNRGVAGIGSAYDRSVGNINAGYDTALGLTNQGYNALNSYLKANPNNQYAGYTPQIAQVTNPMQNYLQAYGVQAPDVQAQIDASNQAAQQGAGAFSSFADLLSRASQQSDMSRLAEAQMAQNLASTTLGANKANYLGQADQTRQQALDAFYANMDQQKYAQEQSANDRYQQLLDSIIAAGGTIPGQTKPAPASPNTTLSPDVIAQLAARQRGF